MKEFTGYERDAKPITDAALKRIQEASEKIDKFNQEFDGFEVQTAKRQIADIIPALLAISGSCSSIIGALKSIDVLDLAHPNDTPEQFHQKYYNYFNSHK